jgi:hypothetical protein
MVQEIVATACGRRFGALLLGFLFKAALGSYIAVSLLGFFGLSFAVTFVVFMLFVLPFRWPQAERTNKTHGHRKAPA